MAKQEITIYEDEDGELHATPQDAMRAEIYLDLKKYLESTMLTEKEKACIMGMVDVVKSSDDDIIDNLNALKEIGNKGSHDDCS